MKQHTQAFKNEVKNMGRQFTSMVRYIDENQEEVILTEELYAISLNYEGALLKSVMKRLEIESTVDIPNGTIINYRLGLLVNGLYEIIDYGNYVVYENEKQEDSDTYKITCYDKILYAMKEYEAVELQYPVTVRDYIQGLCNKLGLTFANGNTNFANYNRTIYTDLYQGIGYTYRDVLDELAQVTASTICINNNDELEIRYISPSAVDTLDEEFLKDVNVKFGEKYGPINSIVLSRSGESDNVYLQDEDSIEANGLCELKISDNQIMNNNDRSDYLADILARLNGLQYYTTDFSSTGILYYDVCDRYNVIVGENTYSCVIFNDEINIEQGLEENIYSQMPEQTETDYTKADKTDRKINQTYLIVDKQNQKIEAVITNTTVQNEKIARITQTVDEINAKISDIADITTSAESDYARLSMEDINQSEPIMIKIHPVVENISYLYPNTGLFPSATTYLKVRTLRFIRTYEEEGVTKTENIDYVLPEDLLWYDNETYDEFHLSYDNQLCQVIKKCKYNADGTVSLLAEEEVHEYEYPQILLRDGDYEIVLLGYDTGYIFAQLMAQNIYTTQFATRAEVGTQINQTAQDILLEASAIYETKANANTNYSSLRVGINGIQSQVSSNTSSINSNTQDISTLQQTATSIQTTVSTKVGKNEVISSINQTAESIKINADKIGLTAGNVLDIISGNTINLTSKNIAISSTNFSVDKNGNMTCNNAQITGGYIKIYGGSELVPNFIVQNSADDRSTRVGISPSNIQVVMPASGITLLRRPFISVGTDVSGCSARLSANADGTMLTMGDTESYNVFSLSTSTKVCRFDGTFRANRFVDSSLKELKKNIEKYNNSVIELIKSSDIYSYNYKTEEDTAKKHLGFVIGKEFRVPKEVISDTEDGIDSYAMTSVLWKAMQELLVKIEALEERIK